MKNRGLWSLGLTAVGVLAMAGCSQMPSRSQSAAVEDYVREPMPAGFQVVRTEIEGPVFADKNGKTLYQWPLKALRNGNAGEYKGKPTCDDKPLRESAGLMSPYPAGLELPEVDTRPSCAQMWPPVYAADNAKDVGLWTVVARPDGRKQWAYDGQALYTSALDEKRGDTRGGTRRDNRGDAPAVREPVGPKPNMPAQFTVAPSAQGRLLTTEEGYSVYTSDQDGPGVSACTGPCLDRWAPVLAAETAVSQGEWSVFERTPGVKQWQYRNKPLYTYSLDKRFRSLRGGDVQGWHNVYTERVPDPPSIFTVQETTLGLVLATAEGKTIYIYRCGDDALDQLACDHPAAPQAYRLAICGGGDVELCSKTFPYLIAEPGAKSNSRAWGTLYIDPKTGKHASADQPGALHVWAFQGRPLYTFGADQKAGDVGGDAWGEFSASRNGFKAFWLRDDFRGNAL